jgi:hypothetical protein
VGDIVTADDSAPDADSPIEIYLDQLVRELSARRPRDFREMLAEAEAHLRDDAALGVAQGLSERDAERQAVARFGPAAALATAEQQRTRVPYRVLAGQVLASAVLLGSIGAVAIGLSGLLAEVFRLVGGARFVVDSAPGQTLAPADCTRWLSLDNAARSCHDAAIADWINEVVWYRVAFGVLGLAAVGAFMLLQRRTSRRVVLLPRAICDTVAVTLFSGAALWTAGMGVDLVAIDSGHGSGQWLSAALVALLAAVVFGVRLARTLRVDAGTTGLVPA